MKKIIICSSIIPLIIIGMIFYNIMKVDNTSIEGTCDGNCSTISEEQLNLMGVAMIKCKICLKEYQGIPNEVICSNCAEKEGRCKKCGKILEIKNNSEEVKVLVEKYERHSGMPGPNGESEWGTTTLLCSDGYIYTYEYDEYYAKTTYPRTDDLSILSKELISKARKTEKKLTEEELKQVKEYIANVVEGKEEVKQVVGPMGYVIDMIADDRVTEDTVIYNYNTNSKMLIIFGMEEHIYFESPSIKRLKEIVNNYIWEKRTE